MYTLLKGEERSHYSILMLNYVHAIKRGREEPSFNINVKLRNLRVR
jgi:hypothetical protein